ncbi:hypothetical protein GCM10027081_03510 [Cupriavidus yeoncheonensis]
MREGKTYHGYVMPECGELAGQICDLALCPAKLEPGGQQQNTHQVVRRQPGEPDRINVPRNP